MMTECQNQAQCFRAGFMKYIAGQENLDTVHLK